jgi:hypothetical protein
MSSSNGCHPVLSTMLQMCACFRTVPKGLTPLVCDPTLPSTEVSIFKSLDTTFSVVTVEFGPTTLHFAVQRESLLDVLREITRKK